MNKQAPIAARDNSTDPYGEFSMDVPEQIFYLLFQIVRHRDARFDVALAPFGLTIARWRTLAVIRRVGDCSMKELSRYSTVDRTTLTRSVDQLVDEGLVKRKIPPTDRRMVVLSLSEKGEEIYGEAVATLLRFNRESLGDIDTGELRALARCMEVVLGNLIEDPDEAEAVIRFGRSKRIKGKT